MLRVIESHAEAPPPFAAKALISGGLKMAENESPDHIQLKLLLDQAKALMLPMFPDQQKVWVAESPLAQEIKSILAKHPEYYNEIRAEVGGDVFPQPKASASSGSGS